MKPNELHGSKDFQRLNPHLFGAGGLGRPQQAKPAPALVQDLPKRQESKRRVVVWIIGFKRRLLDDDNFIAGNKPLRDAIAESVGIDDGVRERIQFRYEQIQTSGREQTIVRIEATL